MNTPAIELSDAYARYPADAEVGKKNRDAELKGINLTLYGGEIVAVLGPNGAGKSTLIRVMSGMLPVSQGSASLFGKPIAEMGRHEIARSVAVVTQTTDVAFDFSVREIVRMGRAPHQGWWLHATEDDDEVVSNVLARCDLTHLASRSVPRLSGGEQKRVAIARALAQSPRVLLLDEPSAFLDVRHQVDLYNLLLEEVATSGIACLTVMHDLNLAAQVASRVVLLKQGEILAAGRIEEAMTYRQLRATFDIDLYVGVNELTGDRFFLPMRPQQV
jgi:iron complex transport system ATP-binding protein